MANRIIIVGGVHGVGKTHFCQKLSDKFDVEHVTASSLIKRHKHLKKNKDVVDVDGNQSVLVAELSRYQIKKSTLLLDGHFCLLSKTTEIEDVPLSTFRAISPFAIFLLKDDPLDITKRISQRDGVNHEPELIASLQEREITRATLVSSALNIPIFIIETHKSFDDSLKPLFPYLMG